MTPREDPLVQAASAFLLSRGAKEVYVFGSYARGEAHPSSDLDLAVRGIPESSYFPLLAQLQEAFATPVDLVLLDSDTAFARHVQDKIDRGWAIRAG